MRLRYFILDDSGQLSRIAQTLVERAWLRRAKLLEERGARDIAIITAACDVDLQPKYLWAVRVRLVDGELTEEAVRMAQQALELLQGEEAPSRETLMRPEYEAVRYQFDHSTRWGEIRRQLAVALDWASDALPEITFGGPLPVSSHMGVSIKRMLQYL